MPSLVLRSISSRTLFFNRPILLSPLTKSVSKIFNLNCHIKMSNTFDSNKIWSRFEAKKKDGSVVNLRIQDLPMSMKDDVTEFLEKYYMKEEAFQTAAGIFRSENAIEEYREGINTILTSPETHSTICCADEPIIENILGLSFMQVVKKNENNNDFFEEAVSISKEMEQLIGIFKVLDNYSGLKMAYETCYEGRGIVVHPDYRGLGVSNEFVRLRKIICMDQNIPMTCAWMTALATQKAAEKNNWKTFAEVSLDEMDQLTGLTFEKKVPSFKLMYTTVE